jgi:hypothetical protein
MESKLALAAERALIDATQKLSPEERLNAFLAHCRLVVQLYEAGQALRSRPPCTLRPLGMSHPLGPSRPPHSEP